MIEHLVKRMTNPNIDITSSFHCEFHQNHRFTYTRPVIEPRYNANKRRRNGLRRRSGRACDYVRSIHAVAFCRPRFSGWAIDFGHAVAFPSGRIDAILRALGVSSPASFTCALHARCIHRCIEGKRRERYGGDGGGICQVLTDFFSLLPFFFFFFVGMKAPLAFLCPSRSGGLCGL